MLACEHIFHAECARPCLEAFLLLKEARCPLCRRCPFDSPTNHSSTVKQVRKNAIQSPRTRAALPSQANTINTAKEIRLGSSYFQKDRSDQCSKQESTERF